MSLPEVPSGVRPVVGDHLSHIAISTRARQWRQVVNFAAVAARRVRSRSSVLPTAPEYPKIFVVGCGRSGTSWVQGIIAAHPRVITTQESHAYEVVYDPVTQRGRGSVSAWTKVLHHHDLSEREARWVGPPSRRTVARTRRSIARATRRGFSRVERDSGIRSV